MLLAYTHSITIRIRQCEIPSAYFSFFFVFVQTIYRSEVTGCSKEVINGYISFPHPSLGFFFVRFVALAPIGDQIPQCGTWLDRDVENKSNLTCTMKILNSSKSMGKVQKGDEGGITYIARKERERERGDTNNATSQVQRPSMEWGGQGDPGSYTTTQKLPLIRYPLCVDSL